MLPSSYEDKSSRLRRFNSLQDNLLLPENRLSNYAATKSPTKLKPPRMRSQTYRTKKSKEKTDQASNQKNNTEMERPRRMSKNKRLMRMAFNRAKVEEAIEVAESIEGLSHFAENNSILDKTDPQRNSLMDKSAYLKSIKEIITKAKDRKGSLNEYGSFNQRSSLIRTKSSVAESNFQPGFRTSANSVLKRSHTTYWADQIDRMQLAERLKDAYNERKFLKEDKVSSPGHRFYRYTWPIRYIMQFLGIFSLIVTRPAWCEAMIERQQKAMAANCRNNDHIMFFGHPQGLESDLVIDPSCGYNYRYKWSYMLDGMVYMRSIYCFYIQLSAMVFLTFCYYIKTGLYNQDFQRRLKMYLKFSSIMLYLVFFFLR